MTGVFGGGVIFVVAALLWAAVLVPTWVRRREFAAAERNAVRLQRTLRVLAETAEVPTELRVEATAREALAHEKLLQTAKRKQEAERQAELAEARAVQMRSEIRAQRMRRTEAALTRASRLRRPAIRRLRAITALCALIALAAVLVGIGLVVAGQGVALLAIAGLALVAAIGGLTLMAPGRVRVAEIPEEREVLESVEAAAVVAESSQEPLRGTAAAAAAHAAAQAAAAERIDRARAMARARAAARPAAPELRNRPESILLEQIKAGQLRGLSEGQGPVGQTTYAAVPPTASARQTPGQQIASVRSVERDTDAEARRRTEAETRRRAEAASRLSRMGVVGDTSDGSLDLDAALRIRRNAG